MEDDQEDKSSVNEEQPSRGSRAGSLRPTQESGLTGHELDMAVAERVMRWVRGHRWGNGNGQWTVDGKVGRTWDNTPRFSTDIAAAMEVVERMFADGWAVDMGRNIHDVKGPEAWDVGFYGGNPRQGKYGTGYCDTLPEAICRAALSAIDGVRDTRETLNVE